MITSQPITTETREIQTTQLHLTPKERQLLSLLEQNPGRCFSRHFLLRNIWGYNDAVQTRTVDVHIRRLRRKLQSNPELRILTVVDHGYMLLHNVPREATMQLGNVEFRGVEPRNGLES